MQGCLGNDSGTQHIKRVSATGAMQFPYLAVKGLCECVGDPMIPPVEYLCAPYLEVPDYAPEIGFDAGRDVTLPFIVKGLCGTPVRSLPDIHVSLLDLVAVSQDWAKLAPLNKGILLVVGQVEVPGLEDVFRLLDRSALDKGKAGKGVNPDSRHDLVAHLLDVEAVNYNLCLGQRDVASLPVSRPHVNADQLDGVTVQGEQEFRNLTSLAGRQHINDGSLFEVGHYGPCCADVYLVYTQDFRCLKLVASPDHLYVAPVHVTDSLLGWAGSPGNVCELIPFAFLDDVCSKSLCHVVVVMDDRQWLEECSSAFQAFKALPVDFQDRAHTFTWGVEEELFLGPMPVQIGKHVAALWASSRVSKRFQDNAFLFSVIVFDFQHIEVGQV